MKYFTIEELTRTRIGIPNEPTAEVVGKLTVLVDKILDPAREAFGAPIIVTSGYRSPEVNAAVGGAKNSQHTVGEAADVTCTDNMQLFKILIDMEFDQLIYEFGTDEQPAWIHISYVDGANRQQVLRAVKKAGKTAYLKI